MKDIKLYKKNNKLIKEIVPSTYQNKPWIYVYNIENLSKKINENLIGKWIIFGKLSSLDTIWNKVIKLVVENSTFVCAKIRTSYEDPRNFFFTNPHLDVSDFLNRPQNKNKSGIICLYIENYQNEEIVFKARDLIRSIGVKSIIKFKTYEATRLGIYSNDEKEFLYIDKYKKNSN